jgi:hypothetical protein
MPGEKFKVGDEVYKAGTGYEGPGKVVATFKSWMGDGRYVVAHKIDGGRGFFYHTYSAKELFLDVEEADRSRVGK